jgi:orotate phosphoribosyltransferase
MYSQLTIKKLLYDTGVIMKGHFVYAKPGSILERNHGNLYVNKDAVSLNPELRMAIVKNIASSIKDYCCANKVDAIIAPPMGAITLAGGVADLLALPVFYAEKTNGAMTIRQTFVDFLKAKERPKVVIVEDILNTGGSAIQTIAAVNALGINCEVAGLAALYNRGGVTASDLDVPYLYCVVDDKMEVHPPDNCPLCAAGVPINISVGHGAEYLKVVGAS